MMKNAAGVNELPRRPESFRDEIAMIQKTTLVILRSERLLAKIRIGLDRGIQRSRHWIARSSRAMTHSLLSHPDAAHRGILLINGKLRMLSPIR